MVLQQPPELCPVHAERPRRGGHVAALLPQRLLDALALLGFQGAQLLITSRLSSARSSLAWTDRSSSTTSSRNSVPPSAAGR
jgi:hypothetical protein